MLGEPLLLTMSFILGAFLVLGFPWTWEQKSEGRWTLIHCVNSCLKTKVWESKCLLGPIALSPCPQYDLDQNGTVDLKDWAIFQLYFRLPPQRSQSTLELSYRGLRATSLINPKWDSDDE